MKSPKLFLPLFVLALIVAMVSFSARAQEETEENKPLLQIALEKIDALFAKVTLTTTDDASVLSVAGKLAPEELCLSDNCISELPTNIWQETEDDNTTYTTEKNISVDNANIGNLTVQTMSPPENWVVQKWPYSAGRNQDTTMKSVQEATACYLTNVSTYAFTLTELETTGSIPSAVCNIAIYTNKQNQQTYVLENRNAGGCSAECIAIPGGNKRGYYGCTVAGGTPLTSTGQTATSAQSYTFCKFDSNQCPYEWQQYENWTATEAVTCSGLGAPFCSSRECTTGEHGLANIDPAGEACNPDDRYFTGLLEGCKSRAGTTTCNSLITASVCE